MSLLEVGLIIFRDNEDLIGYLMSQELLFSFSYCSRHVAVNVYLAVVMACLFLIHI